jgi:hypothetical protein
MDILEFDPFYKMPLSDAVQTAVHDRFGIKKVPEINIMK